MFGNTILPNARHSKSYSSVPFLVKNVGFARVKVHNRVFILSTVWSCLDLEMILQVRRDFSHIEGETINDKHHDPEVISNSTMVGFLVNSWYAYIPTSFF